MQNLMGAYSEAKTLQSMYKNTGKMDSNFTFIIPLYEQMNQSLSQLPSNTTEAYPINVETTGTYVRLRKEASANSEIIKEIDREKERINYLNKYFCYNYSTVYLERVKDSIKIKG